VARRSLGPFGLAVPDHRDRNPIQNERAEHSSLVEFADGAVTPDLQETGVSLAAVVEVALLRQG
jgi:hypothetical protein